MGILDPMNPSPDPTPEPSSRPTPTPPATPEGTESLAVSASREEERREEQREVPRKVQPPEKQTCERCWQTPETWVESACEYNDRVRVTCRECGKFIGYRIHKPLPKTKYVKRRKR